MTEHINPVPIIPGLKEIRDEIDKIDSNIHELLNSRAKLAQQVALVKTQNDSTGKPHFYHPDREAQVLRTLVENNKGPLTDATIVKIFKEIISACLALQQPLSIAYLGPEGTYTQSAALSHFGGSVELVPVESIEHVFRQVETHATDYGVVPVENSTEGMVNQTLSCLNNSVVNICGEINLRIQHHFLMNKKANPDTLEQVFSHYQSLSQCSAWLKENYPHLPRVSVFSNAEAARIASENPKVAAIASAKAGEIYGLNSNAANIEDCKENTTRFLVVGNNKVAPSKRDKTSILITATDKPGTLYKVLEPVYRHNINLTRIETRPTQQGDWSYMFFLDFIGHESDTEVVAMLSDLQTKSWSVKVLGSYPQGTIAHA